MSSDKSDSNPFGLVDLAAGLLGGGKAEEELRAEIDRIAPNASEELIDSTVTGAILGAADIRNRMAALSEQKETDAPIVHAREREFEDGRVGVRLFVDDVDARFFRGERSVLLRGAGWEDEQFLGFEPGEVERVKGEEADDTIAEFLVYPTAEPIDTDYPGREDEEDDEDQDAELEEDEDAEED